MFGHPIANLAPPLWAANPLLNQEFLIATGLLVVALMGGAIAFGLADRWRKKQFESDAEDPVESLTSFRALYENGEITQSEYERIRSKVAARVKGDVAAANPAAGRTPRSDSPTRTDPTGTANPASEGNFSPNTDSAADSGPPSPTS